MFSCGVLLFVALYGAPPFELPAPSDKRFSRIYTGRIRDLLKAWGLLGTVGEDAVDLLQVRVLS